MTSSSLPKPRNGLSYLESHKFFQDYFFNIIGVELFTDNTIDKENFKTFYSENFVGMFSELGGMKFQINENLLLIHQVTKNGLTIPFGIYEFVSFEELEEYCQSLEGLVS